MIVTRALGTVRSRRTSKTSSIKSVFPSRPIDHAPRGFTRQPDHYDVLLNLTLPLDRVVYLTLNYDTLLDQRLASACLERTTGIEPATLSLGS
jgi:hypothetical protein